MDKWTKGPAREDQVDTIIGRGSSPADHGSGQTVQGHCSVQRGGGVRAVAGVKRLGDASAWEGDVGRVTSRSHPKSPDSPDT